MIATYHARLAVMDHSNGTTNKMIMDAMRAEILELRKTMRAQEQAFRKALKAQQRALSAQVERVQTQRDEALKVQQREHRLEMKRLRRNLENNKQQATKWREAASKYQKLAAQKGTRP